MIKGKSVWRIYKFSITRKGVSLIKHSIARPSENNGNTLHAVWGPTCRQPSRSNLLTAMAQTEHPWPFSEMWNLTAISHCKLGVAFRDGHQDANNQWTGAPKHLCSLPSFFPSILLPHLSLSPCLPPSLPLFFSLSLFSLFKNGNLPLL